MKQLEKVQNNTTWAKASNAINNNNDALYVAVTTLEHAAFKNKGYFKSVALLYGAYPTAEDGAQAFVYNSSNPTSAPYDIYEWVNNAWQDSGINGGNVNVNLDAKQDTLVGYSEAVSNGKATQVAIQGDTIALSGKVSLGNVDDMESVILMSSSQAVEAIAKANTLEQSMSALKSPVKPIHLNSQGKLELNIGKGLYIEDGKLCTTGASGGSGGGSTYTEGDGITLNGSKISVKFGDGLKIQDKSLTIATGDGLHIKSGSIAINPSNGLGFTTDGMLRLKLHDKSGLKVDSEGLGVNAGVALGTADGKLNVQYGTGLGKGSDNKLEVLIGTGLALDGNYIKIADAEYTQIEAVDGKQDKLLGYSESKNGDNTLNVNVAASHVGIKGTTDITITSPALNLNNVTRINGAVFTGMQTKGDINLNAKSILSASIDPGELKVLHRGSPYGFIARTVDNPSDPYGLMLVELLSTDGYDSYKYTFPAKSGEVALKSDLDGKQNTLTHGTGINISGNTITVNYGTGLSVSGGKLYSTVQSKTYLNGHAININNNNEINVKYDGVTISTKNTADRSLHVMLGSGLIQGTSGIDVAVGSGLAIGSDNKLYSTVSSGKTYVAGDGINISGNTIKVNDTILNLGTRVYELGDFASSGAAENKAKEATISGDNAIVIMRYTVSSAKKQGVILQQVGDYRTIQYQLWDGGIYTRYVWFTDNTRQTLNNGLNANEKWWKLGATHTNYDSSTRKIHLANKDDSNINADNSAVIPIVSSSVAGLMSSNMLNTLNDAQGKLVRYTEGMSGNKSTASINADEISMSGSSLKLHNVVRVCGALFSDLQTQGNINIKGKSVIASNIDAGELKVLNGASPYGFILRTVNNPNDPQGLMLAELLSTDGYDSYKYTFPAKSGEVALKGDYTAGSGISINGNTIAVQYGTGLGKSTDNKLQVLLGTGLAVEGNYIRVEEAVYDSIEEANARRFMPTYGLEINSDRELFLPNLTASVVNGAVDGSKNGAQRVLNLSCGAIQIKLSTGLAIDDNGYLYVQDKYVTK